MILKNLQILIVLILLSMISCRNNISSAVSTVSETDSLEEERALILSVLNNETKAAFQRDFEGWKKFWVHSPNVTKTYMNFVEDDFSESIGWKNISDFVRTFIEAHPETEPVPELLDKIDIRLYDDGAWVYFEQMDSIRGLKRETRLMEKVDDQWKIAGMHTSIYGFDKSANE